MMTPYPRRLRPPSPWRVIASSLLLFAAGIAAGLALHEGWPRPPIAPPDPIVVTVPTKPVPKSQPQESSPTWNIQQGVEATIEPTPDGLYWATPRLPGREVRFLVQPGQVVRQDTPLLVQDHPGANARELAEQDRREALLNMTIAKRRCELAERELQRALQAKLASSVIERLRVELEVAKDRCAVLQEQVRKAELLEEIADFERNLKIVESPFAGIVLKVEGSRGQTTIQNVGVCVLNPQVVLAHCLLPAAVAQTQKVATAVTVYPKDQQTLSKTGRVTGVTPYLLPNKQFDSQRWSVWIEIRNPESDPAFFPGQTIVVRFPEAAQP